MNHFWSEPYKLKSQWKVDKINMQNKKVLQTIDMHTEKIAIEFLNTKHVYINGVECYSGI